MNRRAFAVALLACGAPALGMPDFIPKPGDVYDDYVALETPRTEVSVGALWIQDYGPSGEGAAPDNVVTERSLSQVTISSELHLGLTAGILNLFGLDPSYRNRLSARFGELSIVRVKDMSKLSGPASEPRIYEAIRAGSITITTDNEAGLDLETRAVGRNLPVVGRSDNGRRRSFSIDGKDMFIAFRVASQENVKADLKEVRLKRTDGGWSAAFNGRDFVLSSDQLCSPSSAGSQLPVSSPNVEAPQGKGSPAVPLSSGSQGEGRDMRAGEQLSLPLRVPIADGKGGLFESASVQPFDQKANAITQLCARSALPVRVTVQLLGRRLQAFRSPKAPRW